MVVGMVVMVLGAMEAQMVRRAPWWVGVSREVVGNAGQRGGSLAAVEGVVPCGV